MLWSVLKGAAEIGMGIYQRITEEDANKKEANQRYRNHFLPCNKCGALAKPLEGTERNYGCECGHRFAGPKHPY